MALPPGSGESFLREVDENYRRDQARDFAKKYAAWIIAALVLLLVAIGAYLFWQNSQRQQAAEASEQLAQTFRQIGTPQEKGAPQKLEEIANGSSDATRATALFAKAAIALENNDRAAALAEYKKISADEGLPDTYRDLATIRQTALEFDSIKPEEVIARLQPYSTPGNPWFGSAGEMTAMALIKQGKRAEAGKLFAAIAGDQQVPDTIRSRAVQIAGTLGVDASAALPSVALQGQ